MSSSARCSPNALAARSVRASRPSAIRSPRCSRRERSRTRRSATYSCAAEVVAACHVRRAVADPRAGGLEPGPDVGELEPVGLVRVQPDVAVVDLGQRAPVAGERPAQLLGDADHPRRDRQLVDQLLDRLQVDAQRPVRVQRDDGTRDVRGDERVAVAVAADPRPQHQWPRVVRDGEPDGACLALELADELGDGVARQLLQVPADRARLVRDRGLARPDLVGLPQEVDEPGDLVVVVLTEEPPPGGVGSSDMRWRPAVECLADPAQHPQHRLARRLGGVRGEHRPQLEQLQGLLHLGPRLAGELLGQPLHEVAQRAVIRRPQRTQLAGAVQLLGGVRELEVLGERAAQRDGGTRVQPRQRVRDLRAAALRRLPRQPADLLDQLQQLRAAVVGEGPAEHGGQTADVGAQRLVLGFGDDAGGGGDGIGGLGTQEGRLGHDRSPSGTAAWWGHSPR